MNKFANVACLVILVALCYASLTEAHLIIKSCSGKNALANMTKLEISNCTSFPCTLKKKTMASIKLTFLAKNKMNALTLNIGGMLPNSQRMIPFIKKEAGHCEEAVKGMQKKCNLERNKLYEYTYGMDVKKEYPSLRVTVQIELTHKGKSVACFTFPAKISD